MHFFRSLVDIFWYFISRKNGVPLIMFELSVEDLVEIPSTPFNTMINNRKISYRYGSWLLNNLSAFYFGPTRRITYSIVLSRRFPTKQLRTCFVSSELVDWCEHNEIDTVCWLFLPSAFPCLHKKPFLVWKRHAIFIWIFDESIRWSKSFHHQKFSFFCWGGGCKLQSPWFETFATFGLESIPPKRGWKLSWRNMVEL